MLISLLETFVFFEDYEGFPARKLRDLMNYQRSHFCVRCSVFWGVLGGIWWNSGRKIHYSGRKKWTLWYFIKSLNFFVGNLHNPRRIRRFEHKTHSGSSGLRCVPKPSYSSRIMKVSNKEIMRFDEISKESFFASAVVYSEGSWVWFELNQDLKYTKANSKNNSYRNS